MQQRFVVDGKPSMGMSIDEDVAAWVEIRCIVCDVNVIKAKFSTVHQQFVGKHAEWSTDFICIKVSDVRSRHISSMIVAPADGFTCKWCKHTLCVVNSHCHWLKEQNVSIFDVRAQHVAGADEFLQTIMRGEALRKKVVFKTKS